MQKALSQTTTKGLVGLFLVLPGVSLCVKCHVHPQGIFVRLFDLCGSKAATSIEAHSTVFLGGVCFNGKELASGKCLFACLHSDFLYNEIPNALSSPFLLHRKVGNVECRVAGLGIESVLVVVVYIRRMVHNNDSRRSI